MLNFKKEWLRPALVIGAGLFLFSTAPAYAEEAAKPAQEEKAKEGGTKAPAAKQKETIKNWDRQAEKSFGLGRGMGRQLMTQEEWVEHRNKMRTMNREEREKYRMEMHQKMAERAKEKGITLPEQPMGPGGPGKGRGMAPGGGMGPGGGATGGGAPQGGTGSGK